jgi:regulator of protease activity HflC (stomatin/prohibitin superfamily)
MSLKQQFLLGVAVLGTITVLALSGSIVETNNEGYYQIKQASFTGDMSVRNTPGMYFQNFGNISDYQISDMYYFGSNDSSEPILVRFNDGSTAKISGSIKFKLSQKEEDQLLLHKDFKNYNAVVNDLVRQTVAESLKQTASLMKAEETYSSKRSEFVSLSEDQIAKGIFATSAKDIEVEDISGQKFIQRAVDVKLDDKNQPVIEKNSLLKRYNIQLLQFVITDIDFDETIDKLINEKKKAEQAKVVAKAKAEEAKQDAITAREQGAARIAQAKADEEVEKIKEVTQALKAKEVAELDAKKRKVVAELDAQKEFEVAKLNRLKAEEEANAKLTIKQAEAKANELLVKAGLTPLEAAKMEMETKIGIARELSNIKLPSTFIGAGSGAGGAALDPFTAVGLESLMRINEKMSAGNKK